MPTDRPNRTNASRINPSLDRTYAQAKSLGNRLRLQMFNSAIHERFPDHLDRFERSYSRRC